MKALFHVLLLVGVLLGLAPQGVALAAEPCPMEQTQISAMTEMVDCCSHKEPIGHDQAPCKDMTPACLAMAGCATLSATDFGPAAISAAAEASAPRFWITAVALYGWSAPPEYHPPARLG
jgi:hypothetical protein